MESSLSRVQTGTSWTTLRTTLPPEAGSSACCSSVVYGDHNLVVVGQGPNSNNSWSGSVIDMNPKNGGKVTTFIPKPGNCANQYFTCTHSSHYYDVAHNTSVISSASPVLLLQNRYLVSIIAHNTHNHNHNHHSRKSVHGYVPQEELHMADLQKYLEKGLVTNVLDWVSSCFSRWISKTANNNNRLFWEPILEMNHCGSALAMANNPQANTVFAVGGYQTLSPKFYQVFASKERVSSAAYMISLDPKRMLQSSATRGNPSVPTHKQVDDAPSLKKTSHNKKTAPISSTLSSSSTSLQHPNNNDWIRLPDMNSRRKNLATVVAGHYLYAIGGQDETGTTVATVERLNLSLISAAMAGYSDMKEIAWEPVAPMKTRRHGHAATTLPSMDGTTIIVVAGGSSSSSSSSSGGNRLDSVEFLLHHDNHQVAAEVWKPLPNLQTPRMGASLSCVNNKLIVAGGTKNPGLLDKILGSNALDTVETLDILVSTFETISSRKASNTTLVPAVATATPTTAPIAPSYTQQCTDNDLRQTRHQQSLTASLSERVQPSAPTLDELYCYNMEFASARAAQQQPSTKIAPQKSTPATNNHDNSASHEDTEDDCWVQLPSTPPPPTPLHLPFPPPVLPPNPQHGPPGPTATLTTKQGDCDVEHDTSCAICLERKKQVAFFCGHQVCLHCSPLVTECHICRQPIQGRIQLYGD